MLIEVLSIDCFFLMEGKIMLIEQWLSQWGVVCLGIILTILIVALFIGIINIIGGKE